jgi:hypothetical protein
MNCYTSQRISFPRLHVFVDQSHLYRTLKPSRFLFVLHRKLFGFSRDPFLADGRETGRHSMTNTDQRLDYAKGDGRLPASAILNWAGTIENDAAHNFPSPRPDRFASAAPGAKASTGGNHE